MTPQVIVVEDEADLRDSVCDFLSISGVSVRGAADGTALDRLWREAPADIVILDVNLPGDSGFAIAARLRERSGVGIIMMTARGAVDDRVQGLGSGADVYLVKPVDLRELLAATRALARRLAGPGAPPAPAPAPGPAAPLSAASWTLDRTRWALVVPSGALIDLTGTEFGILEALMGECGRHVASSAILERLNKPVNEANRRSLDAALSRLRRKVEAAADLPLPVKSVRSVGYVFAAAGNATVNAAP